ERVDGTSEHAPEKLRSELEDAGATLRHELNAATSKLHDEINTGLARLPLEVKTWEPVGEALDQIRQQAHEQARSELQAAVATLRDEFNAATSKLHDEINTGLATPAFEQSAAAQTPEQSTSTPASEQPRGWIADRGYNTAMRDLLVEVKKSRPICESADDYVQIQRAWRSILPSGHRARRRGRRLSLLSG